MKKLIAFAAIIFLSFSTRAQQETKNIVFDANAEVRKVGTFSGVEVSGAIDLYLSQGKEEGVAISGSSDEVKQRIRTEVRGTTLHIYFDGKGWNWKSWGNTKSKAYVTFKDLKKVEASGACNVVTTEPIKVSDFKIDFSGASDFKGDVTVTNLTVSASGASNIRINGNADNASIETSGASNLRAYDLKADYCKTEASGASNIRITVNKELKADASGGSSIYYKGDGVIKDISTSGGASVKKKTDKE